jgi:hypothetical protein
VLRIKGEKLKVLVMCNKLGEYVLLQSAIAERSLALFATSVFCDRFVVVQLELEIASCMSTSREMLTSFVSYLQ